MSLITKRLGYGLWGTVDSIDPTNPVLVDFNDYIKAYDYDSNGNLIYEGWALPGSLKSSASWKIKKYTLSLISGTYVNTDEQWAGGSNSQTNIWNNRASLSYS